MEKVNSRKAPPASFTAESATLFPIPLHTLPQLSRSRASRTGSKRRVVHPNSILNSPNQVVVCRDASISFWGASLVWPRPFLFINYIRAHFPIQTNGIHRTIRSAIATDHNSPHAIQYD